MYLNWQNTLRTGVSSLFWTPALPKKKKINDNIHKFSRIAWSLKFRIKWHCTAINSLPVTWAFYICSIYILYLDSHRWPQHFSSRAGFSAIYNLFWIVLVMILFHFVSSSCSCLYVTKSRVPDKYHNRWDLYVSVHVFVCVWCLCTNWTLQCC